MVIIVFCSDAFSLKMDQNKHFHFLVLVMTLKQADALGDLLQYIKNLK